MDCSTKAFSVDMYGSDGFSDPCLNTYLYLIANGNGLSQLFLVRSYELFRVGKAPMETLGDAGENWATFG